MAFRSADATVSAHDALIVVPSNSTVLQVTRGLYVGATGNIAVRMVDENPAYGGAGNTVTFSNVPVGILPVQVDQVLSTGTTASSILALY